MKTEEQTPRQRFEQLGIEINEIHQKLMDSSIDATSQTYHDLQHAISDKLAERSEILSRLQSIDSKNPQP